MEILASGGVYLGMVIGFFTGMGFQAWRQARRNLETAKAGMPKLKDAVSASRGRAARRLLLFTAYVALVLFFAVVTLAAR